WPTGRSVRRAVSNSPWASRRPPVLPGSPAASSAPAPSAREKPAGGATASCCGNSPIFQLARRLTAEKCCASIGWTPSALNRLKWNSDCCRMRIVSADMRQHALQLVQGAVTDDQLPLALLAMANLHRRAQALGQPLFQSLDIRVEAFLAGRLVLILAPLAHQGLGQAHGQTAWDNMQRPSHLALGRQTEQRAGMPPRQDDVGQQGLDYREQDDQA